jgi:hypothetical protein
MTSKRDVKTFRTKLETAIMITSLQNKKWHFVTKIVRKNCSSDREKLLKFEAKGREFAKCLRSLEQSIQTVKGQNNFCLKN